MSDYDPTDTRSQERRQDDAATRAKLLSDTEKSDIKWLMSSRRGRRLAWGQLERAGVFRLSFSTNALQMAFAEGCRNEGLRLLAQINALCPEHYLTMTKEQANGNGNPDDDR